MLSRNITGNISYLTNFEEIDGGYVAFGGNPKGGKITSRVPRKNNMYSVDLKNIVPKGGLTYLFAKSTSDESKLWHRRLGHINFKTMNKLVKGKILQEDNALTNSKKSALGFMRPFGCHVTILNTIDHLGKFNGKANEGFFVGYSINSKAFRVFNSRTRIVEENMHVQFSTKACDDASKVRIETIHGKDYIMIPLWTVDPPFSKSLKSSPDAGFKPLGDDEKKKDNNVNNINNVNAASTNEVNIVGGKTSIELPDNLNMPELEDYSIFKDDEDVGAEANMNNFDTTI
ncbi:ribonuclease H-like domain-containing protein [Tanacetum coccineum]